MISFPTTDNFLHVPRNMDDDDERRGMETVTTLVGGNNRKCPNKQPNSSETATVTNNVRTFGFFDQFGLLRGFSSCLVGTGGGSEVCNW